MGCLILTLELQLLASPSPPQPWQELRIRIRNGANSWLALGFYFGGFSHTPSIRGLLRHDAHVVKRKFQATGDFGLMGEAKTLGQRPTPRAVASDSVGACHQGNLGVL